MNLLKRTSKFLFSMRFALILLAVMVLVCILGSVVPQEKVPAYYANAYGENLGKLIVNLSIDDVFHSAWFIVLTCLLCLNLIGCNIIRFPQLMRSTHAGFTPEKFFARQCISIAVTEKAPESVFTKMGFRRVNREDNAVYGVKNKIGLWGAWLTHMGMLIIIVGFALGQIFTVKYTVYGVPGQTKTVERTPYMLTIDSFDVSLREDETVEQYTATVTLTDTATNLSEQGVTSVNHPTTLHGLKVYQNSTGWAATVKVSKNGEPVQNEILCAGEHIAVADKPELVILFSAFYPDFVMNEAGKPSTKSAFLNNPAYLYTVYYADKVIGMNVLQDDYISIDEYVVEFEDPRQYTLIQLKRDPFTRIAAIGGALICIALIFSFYLRTEELGAKRLPSGEWAYYGSARKGELLFKEKLLKEIKA